MNSDALMVTGLIRREGKILLVRRQYPSVPVWTLPGGAVESGEVLLDALIREVREAADLEVLRAGRLLYVSQLQDPTESAGSADGGPVSGQRTTTFVFDVAEVRDTAGASGSHEAVEASFWPLPQALELLEAHPDAWVREPLLAYLRGGSTESTWLFRVQEDGVATRIWPSHVMPPELTESMRRQRAILVLGCLAMLVLLLVILIIGVITLARPFA